MRSAESKPGLTCSMVQSGASCRSLLCRSPQQPFWNSCSTPPTLPLSATSPVRTRPLPSPAVGANSALIALIVNLFIGIALGANVVIANAVGRGDREAVQKAVHTSIVFSLLGGIVVAVLGELAAATLLRTLHVPDDVFPQALLYLRIYLMGMPVILLYNFEAAIFRSVGETRVPLVALAMSGVLNVLLNLFFVAVLHMTVNGVAIATVMANAFSSALLFRRLLRSGKDIRLEPRNLRMDGRSLWMILAHRPARRTAERGVRHFQHRHPIRHQQPRQGRYGSLERRLQHRSLRP